MIIVLVICCDTCAVFDPYAAPLVSSLKLSAKC